MTQDFTLAFLVSFSIPHPWGNNLRLTLQECRAILEALGLILNTWCIVLHLLVYSHGVCCALNHLPNILLHCLNSPSFHSWELFKLTPCCSLPWGTVALQMLLSFLGLQFVSELLSLFPEPLRQSAISPRIPSHFSGQYIRNKYLRAKCAR